MNKISINDPKFLEYLKKQSNNDKLPQNFTQNLGNSVFEDIDVQNNSSLRFMSSQDYNTYIEDSGNDNGSIFEQSYQNIQNMPAIMQTYDFNMPNSNNSDNNQNEIEDLLETIYSSDDALKYLDIDNSGELSDLEKELFETYVQGDKKELTKADLEEAFESMKNGDFEYNPEEILKSLFGENDIDEEAEDESIDEMEEAGAAGGAGGGGSMGPVEDESMEEAGALGGGMGAMQETADNLSELNMDQLKNEQDVRKNNATTAQNNVSQAESNVNSQTDNYQNSLNDYNEEVQKSEEISDELKQKSEENTQAITEANETITQTNQSISDAESQLSTANQNLSTHTSALSDLQSQLSSLQSASSDDPEAQAAIEAQRQAIQAQITQMEAQIQADEQQIQACEEQISSLTEQLQAQEENLANLQEQQEQIETEIQEACKDNPDSPVMKAMEKMEQAEAQLAQSKQTLQDTRAVLNTANADIREVNQEINKRTAQELAKTQTNTENATDSTSGDKQDEKAEEKSETSSYNGTIPEELAKKLDEQLGAGFSAKVEKVAKKLNCSVADLIGMMQSESQINPKSVNGSSGATGLIQITGLSASSIDTTTSALKNMSAIEQLDYVEKYYALWTDGSRELTGGDLYAYTFLPGRAKNEVLTTSSEKYYSANKGLDANKDGQITKTELGDRVSAKYQEVLKKYGLA